MRITYLLIAAMTLLGCASRARIPTSDQSMASVYRDTVTRGAVRHEHPVLVPQQSKATATALSEQQAAFPQLPNPLLTIYVFPHQRGGLPVPGYLTTVPLYEQAPFALPSEVPQKRRPRASSDVPAKDLP